MEQGTPPRGALEMHCPPGSLWKLGPTPCLVVCVCVCAGVWPDEGGVLSVGNYLLSTPNPILQAQKWQDTGPGEDRPPRCSLRPE